MSNPRKLAVLTRKKTRIEGDYTLILLGTGDNTTHVHIDNHVTKKSSVLVPISAIKELLKGELV